MAEVVALVVAVGVRESADRHVYIYIYIYALLSKIDTHEPTSMTGLCVPTRACALHLLSCDRLSAFDTCSKGLRGMLELALLSPGRAHAHIDTRF